MSSNLMASPWLIWAIGSIFYAYQYVLRVMPSVLMQDIMNKYDIDAATFGQFSGVYYIGYSLIHIPVGILLDRFGPRKVMPLFMVLTVLGMAPLIFSEFWIYPIVGRALVGIGSSSAILGVFKIIRISFPEEKFAWVLSLAVTIGLLGAIYGGAPVQYLHARFGFDSVVGLMMMGGIILSALAWIMIPEYVGVSKSESILTEVKIVFGNFRVIAICFFAGLMVGPLEGFADVWGPTFLKTVYGIEPTVAAGLPSMMFFGMCFGGPILSKIAEKTGRTLLVVWASAVLMCLAFIALLVTSITPAVMSVLFFGIGILCAYQILAIAQASVIVPSSAAGLTSAVANMIIMMFGYLFHTVIGVIVHAFDMSADGLIWGVSVIPVGLFMAAVGYLFLLPKGR